MSFLTTTGRGEGRCPLNPQERATADISEPLESASLFSGLRERLPLYSKPQPFIPISLANRLLCLAEAFSSMLEAFDCIIFGHGDEICTKVNLGQILIVTDDPELSVERAATRVQLFLRPRRGPECWNTPNRELSLA
jgi:hypothetical protein